MPQVLSEVRELHFVRLTGSEVLDATDSALPLAYTHDHGQGKPASVSVLELRAELLRFGIELHREPGPPQLGAQAQIGITPIGVEVGHEDRCTAGALVQTAQFLQSRQQAVDAQRGPYPRQALFGVQLGQVVITATRADAADTRQLAQDRLEDRAGVIVEAAGDGHIQSHALLGQARRRGALQEALQFRQARGAGFALVHQGTKRFENGAVRAFQEGQGQNFAGLSLAGARRRNHLGRDLVRANLVELVEGPQDGTGRVNEFESFEETCEHLAIVHAHTKVVEATSEDEIVNHMEGLDVGHQAGSADGVEVALHEFAVATALGVLAAPDGSAVVAFEGRTELADVLGSKTRKGNRQVKAHADLAPTGIGEAVHLLVAFRAALAHQNVEVLEGRRVDGHETERTVDLARRGNQPLTRAGGGGQKVAKALERAGLDLVHGLVVGLEGRGGRGVREAHDSKTHRARLFAPRVLMESEPWATVPSMQRCPSALATALALFLVACEKAAQTPASEEALANGANLLLVTLDTTRVDRIGAYGYAPAETPQLDSLARNGARFTRAYAQVPLTLPSHASLLTGTFPPEHGIHDNGRTALGSELTTLAEIFLRRGYHTGAFIAAIALDGSFGLDRGFEVYDDHLGTQAPLAPRLIQRRGDEVVSSALAWLNKTPEPFFAWVHLYDPHAGYEPPSDFAMDDPYDGEVAFMDAQIGRLLGWLDSRRLEERTLVIAIADHGESLGDHGEHTHAAFIYQGTQHIPLLVRGPGVARGGIVSSDLVQQADILPTLMELYGWPTPSEVSGRSFAASLSGESAPETTIYLESDYCALNFGWSTLRGIVQGKWKYIQAPKPELYDLESDPEEVSNLAATEPEVVAALERRLVALRAAMQSHATQVLAPNAERSKALAQLGYAQGLGGADLDTAEGLNPIEYIEVLELYHEAVGFGHKGQAQRMIAPLEEVVASCPNSAGFRAMLGESYVRNGRFADAQRELERALELNPRYEPAYFYLAHALKGLGQVSRAITCLEATLELSPTSLLALQGLADLLWQEGNLAGALGYLEKAAGEDPNSVETWMKIAKLRSELGRWPAVVAAIEKGRALSPKDGGLRAYLAWVLATAPDDAARDGERAVSLVETLALGTEPPDANLLDTLAAAYAAVSRFEVARATARRAEQIAREAGAEALAEEYAARAALYAAKKAFRGG